MKKENNLSRTKDLLIISLSSVLIAICSWIHIPFIVPFTLQTFAIFFILLFEGGKKGLISITIYFLIGIIGLPVFSGFKGGINAFLGATGGYLIGFIIIAIIYLIFEVLFKDNTLMLMVGLILGLLLCYTFGTFWFIKIYTKSYNTISFISALKLCVFPFIVPDLLKLLLAILLNKKLKKFI